MATFWADTFTAADGTTATAHVADDGTTYTMTVGSAASTGIFSNIMFSRATGTPGTAVDVMASAVAAGPAYKLTADVFYGAGPGDAVTPALILRRDAGTGAEYIGLLNESAGKWQIYYFDGGSGFTVIGESAVEMLPTAAFTMEFAAVGSALTLKKDGVLKASATDAILTAAGRVGYRFTVPASGGNYGFSSIAGDDIAGPLAAGAATIVSLGTGAVIVAGAAVSGGTGPYTVQLKRGTDGVTFGTSVGSPQTTSGAVSNQADSGLTDGTRYHYRWHVADSAGSPATADGTAVIAVPHAVGTTFYLSAAGSDAAAGTSSGAAWQTSARANDYLAASVLPGDSLLLRGGDTFAGGLRVRGGGTAAAPVTIGKYGTGTPTISCGDSYGVWVDGTPWVTVRDLIVTGSGVSSGGATTSTDAAVKVTLTGTADMPGVRVIDCTLSGCFYGVKLTVVSGNAHSIIGPAVIGNVVSGCGWAGLAAWQYPAGSAHTTRVAAAVVAGNTVSDIYGVSDAAEVAQGDWPGGTTSGFGLYFGNLSGGHVEGNLVRRTGAASTAASPGGPTGIELYECARVTVAGNEVHHAYAPEGVDGEGIDLDGGCVNCVVEGNYVHDCDGPAVMDLKLSGFTQNTGNVFRWNICVNNGRRSAAASSGFNAATFAIVNDSQNCTIHNNTVSDTAAAGTENKSFLEIAATGTTVRDNAITAAGSGATFGQLLIGTLLQGNNYDATDGASFSLVYDGVTYSSLAALRAVAETVGGGGVGSTLSPTYPGVGGSDYPVGTVRTALAAYDSTVLATAGLDPAAAFGVDPGAADFHGESVRTAVGYPIGAVTAPLTAMGGSRVGVIAAAGGYSYIG